MRSSLIVFPQYRGSLRRAALFASLGCLRSCAKLCTRVKSGRCLAASAVTHLCPTEPKSVEAAAQRWFRGSTGRCCLGMKPGRITPCRKKTFAGRIPPTPGAVWTDRKEELGRLLGCIERASVTQPAQLSARRGRAGARRLRQSAGTGGGHVVFCGVARSGCYKRRCPAKVRSTAGGVHRN